MDPTSQAKLEQMKSLLKSFTSDGTGMPAFIDKERVKKAERVVSLGIKTVTVTFGLFLVMHKLPSTINDSVRKGDITAFLDNAKAKSVSLPCDMVAKLDDLSKPFVSK